MQSIVFDKAAIKDIGVTENYIFSVAVTELSNKIFKFEELRWMIKLTLDWLWMGTHLHTDVCHPPPTCWGVLCPLTGVMSNEGGWVAAGWVAPWWPGPGHGHGEHSAN